MRKRLKVKNDFIFQRIFGRQENKDILLSLLNAILNFKDDNKLHDIEILENTKLEKERIEDKQGILDIKARTIAGVRINIEIQLVNQYNMEKRTLFYWSKLFAEQLNPGQGFDELSKTITINILDFKLIELEKYHTVFHLRENEVRDYILTDILEIHFIELSKFRKIKEGPDISNALDRWLLFLESSSEEVLELIKGQDPAIAKAEKILDWLGSDEETVRLYELREKAIHDEVTRMKGAKKEGREEGRKEGRKEGKEEGIREVAANMLSDDMNIDTIHRITGLPVDELKKIQKNRQH